jgi:hypothetical protein
MISSNAPHDRCRIRKTPGMKTSNGWPRVMSDEKNAPDANKTEPKPKLAAKTVAKGVAK